jgi:hypothetical protein
MTGLAGLLIGRVGLSTGVRGRSLIAFASVRYAVGLTTGRLIGRDGPLVDPVGAGTGVIFGCRFVIGRSPIAFADDRSTVALVTCRLIGRADLLVAPAGAGTASLIGAK